MTWNRAFCITVKYYDMIERQINEHPFLWHFISFKSVLCNLMRSQTLTEISMNDPSLIYPCPNFLNRITEWPATVRKHFCVFYWQLITNRAMVRSQSFLAAFFSHIRRIWQLWKWSINHNRENLVKFPKLLPYTTKMHIWAGLTKAHNS